MANANQPKSYFGWMITITAILILGFTLLIIAVSNGGFRRVDHLSKDLSFEKSALTEFSIDEKRDHEIITTLLNTLIAKCCPSQKKETATKPVSPPSKKSQTDVMPKLETKSDLVVVQQEPIVEYPVVNSPIITRLRVWPENLTVVVNSTLQIEWETEDSDFVTVSLNYYHSYEPTWGDRFVMRHPGWYCVTVTAHSRSTNLTDSRSILVRVIEEDNSSENRNKHRKTNPHDNENGKKDKNHDGQNGPSGGHDGGGHSGPGDGPN